MPTDSNGNYSLPVSYLAVTGQTIQPIQHNPPLEDIASALTGRLPRNGSAPMAGTLNMASNPITAAGDITTTRRVNLAAPVEVASAATADIGAALSNNVTITGTVAIASLGSGVDGAIRIVRFADALTLAHNASIILPGAASIKTAAGDMVVFQAEGSAWRAISYQRASGRSLDFNPIVGVDAKTADYVVTTDDENRLVYLNSATAATFTLPLLASVADGDLYHFRNLGTGLLTLDGNGAELIEGKATLGLVTGAAVTLTEYAGQWRQLDGVPLGRLHVQDRKTAGSSAGTFTSGAWRTRDLNTTVLNSIPGASLAANQIALPAGTYEVEIWAVAFAVSGHQCGLYNVTDTSMAFLGVNNWSETASTGAFNYGDGAPAIARGTITLTAQKVFEVQHICTQTKATDGFGRGMSATDYNVFTDMLIRRVAS